MNIIIRVTFFICIIIIELFIEAFNERGTRRRFRNFVANIRRSRYIKRNRNFVIKKDGLYKLFNKNVICEYSLDTLVFKFEDLKDRSLSAVAKMNLKYTETYNCVDVLDSILFSFNENSTFTGILTALNSSTYFLVDIKNKNKEKPKEEKGKLPKSKEKLKEIEKLYDERININKASEEEISKLPGVSIIKAKKLVQYRILHNGFKTTAEFLKVAGVKPHFIPAISENIFIGKFQNTDDNKNERVIDF